MDEATHKLKHADLLYDYIKFHLGLYIATPPVLAVVAGALEVASTPSFKHGMIALIAVFFLAGIHASWTVASRINIAWSNADHWLSFGNLAQCGRRRFIHHYFYWIGLSIGLCGIAGLLP